MVIQANAVRRLNTGWYNKTSNMFWTAGAFKQHSGFGPCGVPWQWELMSNNNHTLSSISSVTPL